MESELASLQEGIRATCAISATAWMEFTGAIQPKGGGIIKGAPTLTANAYQRRMSAVREYCKVNKRPCRMICLKPRRGGSSTISMAMLHGDLAEFMRRACVMGGDHDQVDKLFDMLRLMAKEDDLMEEKAIILQEKGSYPNGSTVLRETAANPHPSIGGGLEFLLWTEAAKVKSDGKDYAQQVYQEISKCVPEMAGTTIIIESTAWGAAGLYFEKYQESITFEEFKAGKEGFVRVFAPWFEFEDYIKPPASEGIESSEDYTEQEMELALKWKLSAEQVAWMRATIREKCGKSFDNFCQDYPFDEKSAFLSSGRKRFNLKSIERMKEEAKLLKNQPEFGVLELNKEGAPAWRRCDPEDARWLMWEKPRPGCAYIFPVDLMTGASQVAGEDPDNHAPIIIRKGYFQQGKGWIPHRVVARMIDHWTLWLTDRKYRLWWDVDVLEEQVYRGSLYYGGCTIAPELNMDRGLIEGLKKRSANIYQREIFNKREYTVDKALGWATTAGAGGTREMAIEKIAQAVREHGRSYDGVDIHCPICLYELENFIVRESGRSEAKSGCHDDNVLSLGIGITLLDHATTYQVVERERPLPAFLQGLEAQQEREGMGNQWA